MYLSTDTRRIREEIGHTEPVLAEEALRRSADWERPSLREMREPDYRSEDEALRGYSSRTTRRTTGDSSADTARTK